MKYSRQVTRGLCRHFIAYSSCFPSVFGRPGADLMYTETKTELIYRSIYLSSITLTSSSNSSQCSPGLIFELTLVLLGMNKVEYYPGLHFDPSIKPLSSHLYPWLIIFPSRYFICCNYFLQKLH